MSKYKAVFFDFDGTIADTSRGIFASADYAAEFFGLAAPDDEGHRYFMGPPLLESFEVVLGLTGDECKTAVRKYREYYSAGGMFELEFYDGIIDLFDCLNASGIKTAVCSSKPAKFVKIILEHYKIADKIDYICCPISDAVPETKFQLITRAVAHFGIDKSEALMVGDRHLDITGAVSAGVDACGAEYGYGSEKELLDSGADFIAHSVNDVKECVFSSADIQ